jgi:hypothetical protein
MLIAPATAGATYVRLESALRRHNSKPVIGVFRPLVGSGSCIGRVAEARFCHASLLLLIDATFISQQSNIASRHDGRQYRTMKITKNLGMVLLAVYLILDGLLGFGLQLGAAIFLLYIVAIVAGVLILLGK